MVPDAGRVGSGVVSCPIVTIIALAIKVHGKKATKLTQKTMGVVGVPGNVNVVGARIARPGGTKMLRRHALNVPRIGTNRRLRKSPARRA